MSLKAQTIIGVKWTTISTIATTVLQFIQLAIMARILSPSDFGLMAIVMVVMGFVGAFADMGVSNALIHRQTISKNELSSLYWLNVIAGVVMFILVSAIAPLVAEFYKEKELTKLIILLSTTFIIQSFAQQFSMLWQKELRFREIAKIEITNKIISLFVTVYLAYVGYGVYALAYGTIVSSIIQTIQYLYLGLKEYRPMMRFKFQDVESFLEFGVYQMGERTVNYFNYQIDTLLIGKLLGVESLGIYNIAKQLVMKPALVFNPIITRVTFPAMSKIQSDLPKLKEVYLKTINYLSSVNFPIYAFIFIFAYEIILVMFGTKWIDAVLIVKILSLWAAWRSTGNPIGSLQLARGRADLGFWWNLWLFFYVPIGVWIASRWGLVGVTIGLNVIMATLVYPAWKILVKSLCGAGFLEYHSEIIKPAFIAITGGLIAYLTTIRIEQIFIKMFVGGSIEFLLIMVLNWKFNNNFIKELKGFV